MNQAGTENMKRWLSFKNESGEEIPPYAIIMLQSDTTTTETTPNYLRRLLFDKPTDVDGEKKCFAVNSASPVPIGEYGKCHFAIDAPVWGRIESTSGNSVWNVNDPSLDWVGEEWGPVDNQWDVNVGGDGFIIQGPPDIDRNRILVRQKSSNSVETIPEGACTCCPETVCYPSASADITTGCAAVPCLLKTYEIAGSFPFVNLEPTLAHDTGCIFRSDAFTVTICEVSYGSHKWKLTVAAGEHGSILELENNGGTDIPLDFVSDAPFLPFHGNQFNLDWDCGLVGDDTLKAAVRQWPPKICINPVGETTCADCELAPVATGCCDVPYTLTMTTSAPSCAALDGITRTLTYTGVSGGIHFWSGPTFAGGGTCGDLTPYFGVFDGVSCEWVMCLKDGGGTTKWGNCTGTPDLGALTCPFVDEAYTTTTPACSIGVGCAGNLTITVSA